MDGLLPKKQFYRRILPDSCISFASPKGKQLFIESMSSGHMECYFKLSAQFRTQEEPAFCGLTTLVMVLNALEIDPGKVWKGPWRWYHENMLDCCVPLQLIERNGITFNQFLCLAKCNGISTVAVRADHKCSEEIFREKVREYTKRDDSFLILSYSRKVLKQTGDGHFSPVGGYHPEEDMVLMLDTARFKYPPHWIPLPLLFESMKALDNATGQPRGYVTMSRLDQNPLLILFRISTLFSVSFPCGCASEMVSFVQQWDDWLSQENASKNLSNTEELEDFVHGAVHALEKCLQHLKPDQTILTTQLDLSCPEDYITQATQVFDR
ncbi:hypothetical protein KUTeg_007718 [Tegillarca granosa]|uniref:glutathione gamma-glutamylcysteinyltransferase n=1 Tax=Tegillarca granosa TaxID=220873 RepID=A0ABQ9FIL3_TEGGR|nr:hypothetical protein KUTeg_007718 [Tegillarca granosa]